MRRLLSTLADPLARARCLPAHVEIMLGAGDIDAARAGADEMARLAAVYKTPVLRALACEAAAAVHVADGHVENVPETIGPAREVWQQLHAPFIAARLRVLLARAYLALGDAEGALLELHAAEATFDRLGARPSLDAVQALRRRAESESRSRTIDRARLRAVQIAGLTEREVQVLRLVATGQSNKAIAKQLALSPRTVDRHLSNIFAKLGVASRAAATAYAFEHRLV